MDRGPSVSKGDREEGNQGAIGQETKRKERGNTRKETRDGGVGKREREEKESGKESEKGRGILHASM